MGGSGRARVRRVKRWGIGLGGLDERGSNRQEEEGGPGVLGPLFEGNYNYAFAILNNKISFNVYFVHRTEKNLGEC